MTVGSDHDTVWPGTEGARFPDGWKNTQQTPPQQHQRVDFTRDGITVDTDIWNANLNWGRDGKLFWRPARNKSVIPGG